MFLTRPAEQKLDRISAASESWRFFFCDFGAWN
jgi:hypothetical protein